jgi:tryptophan synthase beta chain
VAAALKQARQMSPEEIVLVCLSGRGDKDVETMRSRGLGQQGGGER